MKWQPLERRHKDSTWTLDEKSSLWNDCVLFWGGKGAGKTAIDSSTKVAGVITTTSPDIKWSYANGRKIIDFPGRGSSVDSHINFGRPWIAGPLTISLWCSLDDNNTAVITKGESSRGTPSLRDVDLFGRGASGVRFNLSNGSGLIATVDSTYVLSAAWDHLAVTWDGTTNANGIAIIINGKGSATGATSAVNVSNNYDWNVGGAGLLNYALDGRLYGVGLWSRVLSITEIRQLASRRPDLKGAIRSTIPQFPPSIASTPSTFTTVQEDTFINESPFEQDEVIGTAVATGGHRPYSWEMLKQTRL